MATIAIGSYVEPTLQEARAMAQAASERVIQDQRCVEICKEIVDRREIELTEFKDRVLMLREENLTLITLARTALHSYPNVTTNADRLSDEPQS
jgi:hypothetical protein